MLGYCEDEAKTADAFRNGWLHCGDLGRLDEEGYLYVVDRKKDMIKTGWENVASREIEEVLFATRRWPRRRSSASPTRGGSRR
jgi:fatty-acyl-CoA synthase